MKKLFLMLLVGLFVSFAYAQNKTEEKKSENKAKTEIKVADLKKEITDNIAKDYAGFKVEKAFKNDNNGVTTFNVLIAKDNEKMMLVYDKDGKFVKKNGPAAKGDNKKNEVKKDTKKEEPKK